MMKFVLTQYELDVQMEMAKAISRYSKPSLSITPQRDTPEDGKL